MEKDKIYTITDHKGNTLIMEKVAYDYYTFLIDKLYRIKKYLNSHTRKMVDEIGDTLNDKKYKDLKRIVIADKDTILKIIEESGDDKNDKI